MGELFGGGYVNSRNSFNVSFDIISKTEILFSRRQVFHQLSNMAFSGLRKVLTLMISTLDGIGVLVCPVIFMDTVV